MSFFLFWSRLELALDLMNVSPDGNLHQIVIIRLRMLHGASAGKQEKEGQWKHVWGSDVEKKAFEQERKSDASERVFALGTRGIRFVVCSGVTVQVVQVTKVHPFACFHCRLIEVNLCLKPV